MIEQSAVRKIGSGPFGVTPAIAIYRISGSSAGQGIVDRIKAYDNESVG